MSCNTEHAVDLTTQSADDHTFHTWPRALGDLNPRARKDATEAAAAAAAVGPIQWQLVVEIEGDPDAVVRLQYVVHVRGQKSHSAVWAGLKISVRCRFDVCVECELGWTHFVVTTETGPIGAIDIHWHSVGELDPSLASAPLATILSIVCSASRLLVFSSLSSVAFRHFVLVPIVFHSSLAVATSEPATHSLHALLSCMAVRMAGCSPDAMDAQTTHMPATQLTETRTHNSLMSRCSCTCRFLSMCSQSAPRCHSPLLSSSHHVCVTIRLV